MTDGEMLPLRQARVSNTEHGLREAGDDLWGGLHHDTEMIKAALKWAHARPASAGETSGLCATELWVTADTSDMLQPGI